MKKSLEERIAARVMALIRREGEIYYPQMTDVERKAFKGAVRAIVTHEVANG